jgi:hypothetical protein
VSLRPSICVDFDGTICDFAFPNCGPLKPGVKEALEQFRSQGFYIIISSCRTCGWNEEVFGNGDVPVRGRPAVKSMVAYLDEHALPYDEIDFGEKGKVLADYMIDDRGISFRENWSQIANFIAQRGQVWQTQH